MCRDEESIRQAMVVKLKKTESLTTAIVPDRSVFREQSIGSSRMGVPSNCSMIRRFSTNVLVSLLMEHCRTIIFQFVNGHYASVTCVLQFCW